MIRLLFLCLVAGISTFAQTRLAILNSSDDLAPAADLLTAEFSKATNLAALERAQIQRLLAEQSLSQSFSARALKAGSIAGAEALLVLDHRPVPSEKRFSIRLIATKPGAVLRAIESKWPPDDSARWAQAIVQHFSPVATRLSLPAETTIKISVLNLRSAVTSPDAQRLDRELTALLLLRLGREPFALLVERQQLAAASLEKDLLASTERFWTGGLLLDGVVNRNASDPTQVTVDLRVQTPGQPDRTIHAKGPRAQLSGIIDQLVGELLKGFRALPAPIAVTEWASTAEAAKFVEEAEWSTRWNMHAEARAAADAAWALGLHNERAAAARIIAYTRSADERDSVLITSGADGSGYLLPQSRPYPERLPFLPEGLAFAADYLRENENASQDRRVYEALTEALEIAGDKLVRYYHIAETRAGNETLLATTRAHCRQLLPIFLRHPEVTGEINPRVYAKAPELAKFNARGLRLAFNYAALFHEKPEDVLPFYREFLTKASLPDRRVGENRSIQPAAFLEDSDNGFPLFAGWRVEDRLRVYDVEIAFARELAAMPGPAERVGKWILNRYPLLPPEETENKSKLSADLQATAERMKARREAERNAQNPRPQSPSRTLIQNPREMAELARRRAMARTNMTPRANAPMHSSIKPATIPAGSIHTSNYWSIVLNDLHKTAVVQRASIPLYRNGKIWIRVVYSYPKTTYAATQTYTAGVEASAIVSVTPEDWRSTAIAAPVEPGIHHAFRPVARDFEVTTNAIWLIDQTAVHLYDLQRRQWKKLPLLADAGELYLIADRLYCSGNESIYEIKSEGRAIEILASVRRRPAISPLDELAALKRPLLTAAPGGRIRAYYPDAIWNLGVGETRREVAFAKPPKILPPQHATYFTMLSNVVPSMPVIGDARFLFRASAQSPTPESIAYAPGFGESLPTNAVSSAPQFFIPSNILEHGIPFDLGTSSALIGPQEHERNNWKNRKAQLLVMHPSATLPITIDLLININSVPDKTPPGIAIFAATPVIVTPSDIIFSPATLPGFVKFPRAEIDRRLQATIATAQKK